MRIRERLEQLEAARRRRNSVRPQRLIDRLEGQTDEEAWGLSEYADLPFDGACVILSEGNMRGVHCEIWGEQTCNILGRLADHYADEYVAKTRHEQEAVRRLIATGVDVTRTSIHSMSRSLPHWHHFLPEPWPPIWARE